MKAPLLKTLAVLVVSATALSPLSAQFQLETAWSLAPGDHPSLGTGHAERGMTFNPATGNLLIASRTGGLNVAILSSTDGSHLGYLSTAGISGGNIPLNMIGAGADGAIYGVNLTIDSGDAGNPFRIYRWENESSAPQLIFSGDPNNGQGGTDIRFGDTLAVRGAGSETEILATSRNGTVAALFDSGGAHVRIDTGAAAGDLGLGVAFDGNTFWSTAALRPLHQVNFDGTLTGSYSSSVVSGAMTALAVDEQNRLLAGLRYDTHEVYLYNLATLSETIENLPLDIKALATANGNDNGTGAMVFANGQLFVLGTNNGLTAFNVIPEPGTYALLFGFAAVGLLALKRRRRRAG